MQINNYAGSEQTYGQSFRELQRKSRSARKFDSYQCLLYLDCKLKTFFFCFCSPIKLMAFIMSVIFFINTHRFPARSRSLKIIYKIKQTLIQVRQNRMSRFPALHESLRRSSYQYFCCFFFSASIILF